jgi:diketogulonate reductase-like aldo/keto reductase
MLSKDGDLRPRGDRHAHGPQNVHWIGACVGRGPCFAGAASIALAETGPLTRTIPSSGETMPLVGLGSWITFNVGDDPVLLDRSADVIKAFVDGGGRMIDSSPMYGSAQNTIGYGLNKLGYPETVFAADKVWTSWPSRGRSQIAASRQNWGVPEYDLVQVHNLWRGKNT